MADLVEGDDFITAIRRVRDSLAYKENPHGPIPRGAVFPLAETAPSRIDNSVLAACLARGSFEILVLELTAKCKSMVSGEPDGLLKTVVPLPCLVAIRGVWFA